MTAQTRHHCRNRDSQAPACARTNQPNVPITQQICSQLFFTQTLKQRAAFTLLAPTVPAPAYLHHLPTPNRAEMEKVQLNVSNESRCRLLDGPAEASGPFLAGLCCELYGPECDESIVCLINRSVSAQLLQLTGKAAFQRALIDISSRGKLPPSVAKSCTRPAETQRDGGRR